MNTKLLLFAIFVTAFTSCTTLYKSGQTPDDVYFSPVRVSGGGDVEDRRHADNYQANNYYNGEERTIRLGINDYRYRYLDNGYSFSNSLYLNDYSYTPYNFGFNYGYYYNPFFWPYPVYGYGNVFVKPVNPKNTTPRMTNLAAYGTAYNGSRFSSTTHGGPVRPVRNYNNMNSNNRGSAVGNAIRQALSPSNSNSNSNINNSNNNTSSNRSYSPSSSGSSSSSGGSSGGGGVSRPSRN